MKKTLFLTLIFILNCQIFKKNLSFYETLTRDKKFFIVENALKKININIDLKVIKIDERQKNLLAFKNSKDVYLYFYDKDSKHIPYDSKKSYGEYNQEFNFIEINNETVKKLKTEKQIGIVAHEIGHAFGLMHFNNKCNFMISGIDNCSNYSFEQKDYIKKYINNSISKDELKKYFFNDDKMLKNINKIKNKEKITLYLIID